MPEDPEIPLMHELQRLCNALLRGALSRKTSTAKEANLLEATG